MTTGPDTYLTLPEGDPHYAAVGLVASHWARLERTADHAIWELIQAHPPVTACITAQLMGFAPKVRTIMALHHQLGGDEQDHKKLRGLLNNAHGIQQERNRVVHDPWHYNPKTNVRARYAATTSSDGKPKFEFVAVSIKELSALAKRIFEFDEKVWRSLEEILQPFRDKHPGWFSVGRIE